MPGYVLITGASGGIGYELAKIFATFHDNLVLVARTEDRLITLKNELEKRYGNTVKVIVKDLEDPLAPEAIFQELEEAHIQVDILINNAGFGSYGTFSDADWSTQLGMIHVNISALTHLTKLAIVGMKMRGKGKIMNVASTAAFQPGPLMAVYYATKAYVLSFSEAIANELQPYGITVTALCPGFTETGFGSRANLGQSKIIAQNSLDVATVARMGYVGMMKGKTLVIPSSLNRALVLATRFVPRRVTTHIVRRIQDTR